MRSMIMNRDVDDLVAGAPHRVRVLDVQRAAASTREAPSTWDVVVFVNNHDTRIVIRQHRLTGAMRIKAIPAKTVDLHQPEPYELELLPDVPYLVVLELLEILK